MCAIGLFQRLCILDLAELGEIGLMLAEVAEIFEGSQCCLYLELEVDWDHAVSSLALALQLV